MEKLREELLRFMAWSAIVRVNDFESAAKRLECDEGVEAKLGKLARAKPKGTL